MSDITKSPAISKLLNRGVYPEFRLYILSKYQITHEQLLFSALDWFGTHRDRVSGQVIADYYTMAEIEGRELQAMHKNYSSKPFIQKFNDEIAPADLAGGSYSSKKAQTLWIDWPDDIKKLVMEELKTSPDWDRKVNLFTGEPVVMTKRQEFIDEKMRALSLMKQAQVEDAREALLYFNNLPREIYTTVVSDYFDDAVKVALDQEDKMQQLRILSEIGQQPVPFIKPVSGSTRLYQTYSNMMIVKKEIRRALTPTWIEADLKNCQLAVASKIWNIPEVAEFLRTGQSFWNYLEKRFGVGDEYKWCIKDATYAMLYGARRNTVEDQLEPLGVGAGEIFFNDPLVKKLNDAKRYQLSKIGKEEGAKNAYGKWIGKENVKKETKDWRKSVLSQVNQSYELKLLMPAIKLAIEYRWKPEGFYLPLYQFDGFSIRAKDITRTSHYLKQIEQSVNDEAEKMGIPTRLEFE